MKAIYKSLIVAALSAPLFTSCIEEAIPTDRVIESQLQGNAKATEALVYAMPGHMNAVESVGSNHWDFGAPSIMHIRDVMTEDMPVLSCGRYDHFTTWAAVSVALGEEYLVTQYPWVWFNAQILSCNNVLGAIPASSATSPELKTNRAAGLAYRAMTYLDMARMYEVLPVNTDVKDMSVSSSGKNILGLTVPIVTPGMTEEELRKNPRAPHEEMYDFITGDLEEAIALYQEGSAVPNKTIPSLAVAYGLMARACLWDASYKEEMAAGDFAAQYKEAARYARLAITTGGNTPLTQDQWHNTSSGFNDINVSSWMLGGQYVSEDDAVQTQIVNWASFMVNEQEFGYTCVDGQPGAQPMIGASLYNRMSDRDWRKLSWVAPEGSSLKGREPFLNKDFADAVLTTPYVSIKFRPGQGEMTDPKIAAAIAYPLMRVEEMYLIEAEATAHVDAGAGKNLLENFMKTYRYPSYACVSSSTERVVEEIVFQKRIELWGEGQSFFDMKRLNMSVTRAYEGSNFDSSRVTFNTNGRPAWMNFVIVRNEIQNNKALTDYNTQSPAGIYSLITLNK